MRDSLGLPALYSLLKDMCQSMSAGGRGEEIAVTVMVKVAQAFQAQGALLHLFPGPNGAGVVTVGRGLGELYQETGLFPGPETVAEICRGNTVQVISDPGHDPRLTPPATGDELPIQTLVALTLGRLEESIGVICLLFEQKHNLSTEELDFLTVVAQNCTWVLNKTRLIDKQRQQFEQLASQTERLTALGRMAAGVTHELNNPLSSILLYSSNMLKKVPADSFLHEGTAIIIQETKRCKTIIQELQEFSRSKEPKKILGKINTVLEKVIHLLENEFRRRTIRLHRELAANLPTMLFDIGQMQQVFANLLINASEAVNSKGGVTVSTRFDESGQVVVIEIADTGPGIPKEYLGRICEPFFSTKPRGTGLGLAVTCSFIQNHQGDLRIESEPGQGARFIITMPVITPESEPTGKIS